MRIFDHVSTVKLLAVQMTQIYVSMYTNHLQYHRDQKNKILQITITTDIADTGLSNFVESQIYLDVHTSIQKI